MPEIKQKQDDRITRVLKKLDSKLAALPPEQQNLAAAYAQGLRAGFRLRCRDGNAKRGPSSR